MFSFPFLKLATLSEARTVINGHKNHHHNPWRCTKIHRSGHGSPSSFRPKVSPKNPLFSEPKFYVQQGIASEGPAQKRLNRHEKTCRPIWRSRAISICIHRGCDHENDSLQPMSWGLSGRVFGGTCVNWRVLHLFFWVFYWIYFWNWFKLKLLQKLEHGNSIVFKNLSFIPHRIFSLNGQRPNHDHTPDSTYCQ